MSAVNPPVALTLILQALERRQRGYIAVTSVHGIMEAQTDERFRGILNSAFLCLPDGMPLVWSGRINGHPQMDRVYGPDLLLEVCRASVPRRFKHFFYGGKPGVAQELKRRLVERFPGLIAVGHCESPFRPLREREADDLRRRVDATRPDVLWVGLSTPKQEIFMAEYLPKLNVTLMTGVGAAFDYHSGRVKQAPRWVQRAGFEWLYRFCHEPCRLWRRNLKNFGFIPLMAGQWSGLQKYELP